MASTRSWLKRLRLSDGALFAAGVAVGWQLDVSSRVVGTSMEPTLSAGDRLFHVPVAVWSAASSLAGLWRHTATPSVSSLVGSVVVAQVTEQQRVCKRVSEVVYDETEVHQRHVEVFQSNFADSRFEHPPIVAPAVSSSNDLPSQQQRQHHKKESVYEDEDEDEPRWGNHCEVSEEDTRPYRRTEWDWCAEQQQQSETALERCWVWLEGDNSKDSFDSTHVGFLPCSCLRGVVWFRFWPTLSRIPARGAGRSAG